jgi:uncharacterized membrane protein YkvI
VMGALFLVGSSSCWSLWLILQVNSLCNHDMPRLDILTTVRILLVQEIVVVI